MNPGISYVPVDDYAYHETIFDEGSWYLFEVTVGRPT
jgi:hypothetical protein